ncbi:GNAT family N-acetyltransferase [Halopelagius longus]|uniref:GNAT family N-acetyltransferase n=1 Tax=Halopelagius longus TaxID=1236180 RepID=A0A1H0YMS2_9EURY|nr:GNAT family N-acetyltransferase [Halopelagius longus]RDI72580.1 GNAT family N-acetyltransferase [Halopelagius longus]SDQ16517.1 Ribosomal protein S18 acetylase RimI [Halopelagius longus]
MTAGPRYEYEDEAGETVLVRPAREEDYDAVAAFTSDTWGDRGVDDYIGDVYPDWIADDDGETRQTFVVDAGADAPTTDLGGIVQVTTLSGYEAWAQGMRVNPDYRGRGLAKRLSDATFRFAREAGASVIRNMIFSWNVPSLGLTRDTGYDPGIEFRWVHPDPDADAAADLRIEAGGDADPDAAWSFWTGSDVRTDLKGLVLDPDETWALSSLTRARLRDAADDGRLFVVREGGTRGFAYRNRTYDRENDDGETETWAEYAVGAWARDDAEAARAVVAAVSRDAAAAGADRTRVLVPEGPRWVTDAAVARADLAEQPTFVMEADLT